MSAESEWEKKHDRTFSFGIGWEMRQMLIEMDPGATDTVLEIGSFQGDSLKIWREVLDPSLLIGVQDTDEVPPELAAAIDAKIVRGKSQDIATRAEVALLLDGRQVDMLYIDGDHMYDAAKRDWELYSPLVRPGGIIVLHDAVIEDNPTVEVYTLYRELRVGRRSKLIYAGLGSTGTSMFFV